MGKKMKASVLIDEVLAAEPNDEAANRIKGAILFENKDYTNSLNFFSKVPEDFLESEDFINIAKANLGAGDTAKAITILEKASTLDPEEDRILFEQGKIYLAQKNYDMAISTFDKAIAMETKNGTVYFAKGVALYQSKKNDEALATFNSLIGLDPTYSLAYFYIGIINYDKKREADGANNAADSQKYKDEAIKYFQKVLEIEPDNADATSFLNTLQGTTAPSN